MGAYNDLSVPDFVAEFKRALDVFKALEDIKKRLSEEDKDMATYNRNYNKYDNDKMLKMAKKAVVNWYNTHNGPAIIAMDDVFVVWFCKTLQNWKALCGTNHSDGMYYEVTFDGDKDCAYVDAYKKWDNQKIDAEELT